MVDHVVAGALTTVESSSLSANTLTHSPSALLQEILCPIEDNSTLEGGVNIGKEVFSDVCDYQDVPSHNIHQVTGPNPTSIHTPDDVIVSSVAMESA